MKSQQAIAWQRKIATAVMIVVPILVAVAVFGGFMPIGTISSSWRNAAMDGLRMNFSPIPDLASQINCAEAFVYRV
jgi:hypothetical protein